MSDFRAGQGDGLRLDARKRVNYTLGMVLGEDEFRQEQFHLRERDHLATRGLHGYGTLAGLGVAVDGPQVTVGPGLAVDPAGLVCVPSPQCADLTEWLAANQDAAAEGLGSPVPGFPAPLALYVVLCYRECETDTVPVLIEPCRTADESMVASRLSESFELKLAINPPAAVGEVASGRLGNALDDLLHPAGSLPDGSPPDVSLPAAGVTPEDIRAGLRAWAVEQRPEVGAGSPCLGAAGDACVLLARLDLEIEERDGALVLADPPVVDDVDRPILVSSRFLQEWLIRLTAAGPEVGGPPGVSVHHDLLGLGADDHDQYLLADGSRALAGRLRAGGHRLTGVADAQAPSDAVTLRQLDGVLRQGDAAGGDLTDSYPNPGVGRLRGVPVAGDAPSQDDSLMFAGGAWRPQPVFRKVLPFVTIARLGARQYRFWFNVDAPRNAVEIPELTLDQVVAFRETPTGPAFLTRVPLDRIDQVTRNLFTVILQQEPINGLLRFRFALQAVRVSTGGSVSDYARAERIVFEGQTSDSDLTKFFLIPTAG